MPTPNIYQVLLYKKVDRQLTKLPIEYKKKIVQAIGELGLQPSPQGHKKLSGVDHIYRIRIGTYRILYQVDKKANTVTILRVAHRKDVYR